MIFQPRSNTKSRPSRLLSLSVLCLDKSFEWLSITLLSITMSSSISISQSAYFFSPLFKTRDDTIKRHNCYRLKVCD